MKNKGSKLLWYVAFLLLLLIAAANAQMVPCQGIERVQGYKVLLDEIKFSPTAATASEEQRLMRILLFDLENQLLAGEEEGGPGWVVIPCLGRLPDGESSFPDLSIDGLNRRDVVLEIWGQVFTTKDVFLNYVLISIPKDPTVNRFLVKRYKPNIESADELVDWLAGLNELSGYALVTRAIRQMTLGRSAYDQAKRDLEKGDALLTKAFGATPDNNQALLLKFVRKRKCEVLRLARSDQSYNGVLKAIPLAQITKLCPEVTQ